MRYFPVFLDLRSKICLVVGAGPVGKRKISTLSKCSAGKIVVIDPRATLKDKIKPDNLVFKARPFRPEDVQGCHLVFACTGDPDTNLQVIMACREENIWCNAARNPDQGDFILPAVLNREDLILAVSTCGTSPALSARIKKELMQAYGPEYSHLTKLMSGIRKSVLPLGFPQKTNQKIFERILDSQAAQLIDQGDREGLQDLLQRLLPSKTHNHIREIINDLF